MSVTVYNGTLSQFNAATDPIAGDHYSYIKLVDATAGSLNLAVVDSTGKLQVKSILANSAGTNIAVIDSSGKLQTKTTLSDTTGANIAAVDASGKLTVKGVLNDLTGANTAAVDAQGRLSSTDRITDSSGVNFLAVDATGRASTKTFLFDSAGTNVAVVDTSGRLQTKNILADATTTTNTVIVDSGGMLHGRFAPMTETFLAPAAVGNKVITVGQTAVSLSTHMTGAAANATHAFIRVRPTSAAGVTFWIDGDTPTATNGMDLQIGEAQEFSSIASLKLVSASTTASATITVQYKRFNSTTF